MKYLYYYENYAQSEKYGNPLTEEEFNKLYIENCKIHSESKVENGSKFVDLWRGIRDEKYISPWHDTTNQITFGFYQNPKGHTRHSIEKINLHVILMSELPSWEKYPKYNQSVIASTNKGDAKAYGNMIFEVIPFDNTKVGVCSHDNIWSTFGGYGNFNENPIYYVNHFISVVCGLENINISSWDRIKTHIERYMKTNDIGKDYRCKDFLCKIYEIKNGIPTYIIKHPNEESEIATKHQNLFQQFIKNIKSEDVIKFIEFMFEPNRNGFNNFKYDDTFNDKLNNLIINEFFTDELQVWCEGPVLLKRKE